MKQKIKVDGNGVFLLVLAFSITACAPRPSVYLPNSPHTPLLTREGECRISLASNVASNRTGEMDNFTSLEAAYALTDKIGIVASCSYSPVRNDSNNVGLFYGELGAGYFTKIRSNGRFEVYGGVGIGNTRARYYDQQYPHGFPILSPAPFYSTLVNNYTESSTHYFIPFVQASLGAEGDVAAIAFSVRISMLNTTRFQLDSLFSSSDTLHRAYTSFDTSYTINRSDVFLEPGLTFRIGYQHIKLDSRLWWSLLLASDPPFLWGSTNLSMGLTFDF